MDCSGNFRDCLGGLRGLQGLLKQPHGASGTAQAASEGLMDCSGGLRGPQGLLRRPQGASRTAQMASGGIRDCSGTMAVAIVRSGKGPALWSCFDRCNTKQAALRPQKIPGPYEFVGHIVWFGEVAVHGGGITLWGR